MGSCQNRTALEALQREVPSVRIFSTDMTKQASFDSLKLVLKEKPHISWLVCSAGAGTQKEVAKTECRDLENMIQLNCTALTLMTRLCLPYCRNGQILLLASGAAFCAAAWLCRVRGVKGLCVKLCQSPEAGTEGAGAGDSRVSRSCRHSVSGQNGWKRAYACF